MTKIHSHLKLPIFFHYIRPQFQTKSLIQLPNSSIPHRKSKKKNMKTTQNKNTFLKIITTPYRALIKVRDFYVNSMTNCAGRVSYGGSDPGALPRSFSVASTRSTESEDFRDLLRAASVRTLGTEKIDHDHMINKLELEILLRQQMARRDSSKGKFGSKGVMRSVSVGMGRIDEDGSVHDNDEFDQEESVKHGKKVKSNLFYPRSKSYAVNNKTLVI